MPFCALRSLSLRQTTLLNILGTIDSATSGSVEMFGEIIDANSSDKKLADLRLQKIGFVFQVSPLLLAPSLAAACRGSHGRRVGELVHRR